MKWLGIAILLLIIVGSVFVTYKLSIVPGAEGLRVVVVGFNPSPPYGFYDISKNEFMGSYHWSSRDPYNAIFGYDKGSFRLVWCVKGSIDAEDAAEIQVNVGQPQKLGSELEIRYWVKLEETESYERYKKVVAWREIYELPVEISARALMKDGRWFAGFFKNTEIWFAVGTVVWNNAISDPENPKVHSINHYNVPIDAFVEGVYIANFVKNDGTTVSPTNEMRAFAMINPEEGGRRLTLYSNHSTLADPLYIFQITNETLAGDPRPDTRFPTVAYFKIDLEQFGTYVEKGCEWGGFGGPWANFYYPVVTVKLRIVYFRFGEFIYTYDKDTEPPPTWTTETPIIITTTPEPFINLSWLRWDNPLTWVLLAVLGIVLVVLLIAAFGFASRFIPRR